MDGNAGIKMKGPYLTAPMLAQLCGVTLPTIHTWAERKLVPCFRTPGRQLRFKPREVAVWMRARGYDVPEGLEAGAAAE